MNAVVAVGFIEDGSRSEVGGVAVFAGDVSARCFEQDAEIIRFGVGVGVSDVEVRMCRVNVGSQDAEFVSDFRIRVKFGFFKVYHDGVQFLLEVFILSVNNIS